MKLFIASFADKGKISLMADMLAKVGNIPTLESLQKVDSLKKTIDDIERQLEAYSKADLTPKEVLSKKWTLELGDVPSVGMLSHLKPPEGRPVLSV